MVSDDGDEQGESGSSHGESSRRSFSTDQSIPVPGGQQGARSSRGPILGPFERRSEASDAEVAWPEANWLGRC